MEFVDGESLADILDRRVKIPEAEALGIAIQVARGMQCAWENDIVHRDIKPGNILMTRNGTAKIADLGLVREVGAADSTSLTQVGTVLGTPDYLAPEQAEGGPIDVRTDIYAFGITLYEMVTGELPFNGEDAWSVIKARFKTRPQPVYAMTPGVSEEFSGIIETMMALAPDHRYPDPTVLLDDLISVAEGGVPRYAVSLGSSRGKVAEDARTRQSQVMSGPVPVVLRKRRRRRLLVGGGAAGGAAVLILLTVVLFSGGPRTDPLEDEAKAFFDGMVGMFSEGDYARVVQEADEAGTKYVGTPLWGDIARLRIDAESEVVKGKLFADLVRQARSGISSGDHEGALRLLTEAIKLRRTAEVEELMEGTRRLAKEKRHKELLRLARTAMKGGDYETARQHLGDAKRLMDTPPVGQLELDLGRLVKRDELVADGELAEREGQGARAIALFEEALGLEDDPELRSRVAKLKRSAELARLMAEADAASRKKDWTRTIERYREARVLADRDGRARTDSLVKSALREQAYATGLRSAEAALTRKDWAAAREHALGTLKEKPGDEAAKALLARIERAIPPPATFTDSIGMKLVLVPGGEFTMGSSDGDADERPPHKVRVDSFYIGRCEITNAQYEKMSHMHRDKWKQFSDGDDMPVVAVSWREATAFCEWLSRREGATYRLPTEAQWEVAARGKDQRAYPWGDVSPSGGGVHRCNFAPGKERALWKQDGFEFAASVGVFPEGVSPHGCHDMAGNVWEWCRDRYAPYDPRDEAPGGSGGTDRAAVNGTRDEAKCVLRGGSFSEGERALRCANRAAKSPGYYDVNIGFRVVRELGKRPGPAAAPGTSAGNRR
jgi:formylglycine-generating enzyme required for sulfatase activity